MKVILYGATGHAGSCILKELLSRRHEVIGVVRNPDRISEKVECQRDDLSDVNNVVRIIDGADAIISAVSVQVDNLDSLAEMTGRLIEAVQKTGVSRLLTVGGCGTLEYSPGVNVMESGYWPEKYMPHAIAHARALKVLQDSNINWTCLSPAMVIENGERTGKFRLGEEKLIKDAKGESRISFEDYAIAMVDELENSHHERQRFTIGY